MKNKFEKALHDLNDVFNPEGDLTLGMWADLWFDTIHEALLDKVYPGGWLPIETAPKDGTEIEVKHSDGEQSLAVWSDRPVCMLGSVNGGFPSGWATGPNSGTDTNLPLNDVVAWRPK